MALRRVMCTWINKENNNKGQTKFELKNVDRKIWTKKYWDPPKFERQSNGEATAIAKCCGWALRN